MYEKEDRKTNPSGIRFKQTQLAIALGKSGKKSKQQLVDFLIEKYVNGDNPIIERLSDYSVGVDQYKKNNEADTPPAQVFKTWQYYMNKIPTMKDIDDCKKLDTEIRRSGLMPNEIKRLIDNLVTHSQALYSD